jgi:enamine deaminase RidA (YjgF/YER057c/UK114 family)
MSAPGTRPRAGEQSATKTILQPDLGREYSYLRESQVGQLTHSAGVVVTARDGLRFIYCSGKTATDDGADTAAGRDVIVGAGDIGAQTRQVCRNLQRVLASAGATMDDIVRVRVYVVHPMSRAAFSRIHDARSEFFSPRHYPASTLVVVSGLARPEAMIEMDADAVTGVNLPRDGS